MLVAGRLADLSGIVIPGGFGKRGIEGKIAAAAAARQNHLPTLGLCLGLQVMVIEFCRNQLGLMGANSTEFDAHTLHPVIDLMHSQRNVTDLGGTMRLGTYLARLEPSSRVAAMYGDMLVAERHRHRYEVNNAYQERMAQAGLKCSGLSPDGLLAEFIELEDHPFWIGTQAHPEFRSRPNRPAPLFSGLVGAAIAHQEAHRPSLFQAPATPHPQRINAAPTTPAAD